MAVVPVFSDTFPSLALAQPLCSSADYRVTLISLKPRYKITARTTLNYSLFFRQHDNNGLLCSAIALACLIAITYVHVVRN